MLATARVPTLNPRPLLPPRREKGRRFARGGAALLAQEAHSPSDARSLGPYAPELRCTMQPRRGASSYEVPRTKNRTAGTDCSTLLNSWDRLFYNQPSTFNRQLPLSSSPFALRPPPFTLRSMLDACLPAFLSVSALNSLGSVCAIPTRCSSSDLKPNVQSLKSKLCDY
jgi:hypothetical protein